MKVDSRSFPESICTPESKSIRGRGGHHNLLLFWYANVTGANATPFCSDSSFQNTCFHCLNRMNKRLGMRIPDCLVDQKSDYV
jgi:hypothetical protein